MPSPSGPACRTEPEWLSRYVSLRSPERFRTKRTPQNDSNGPNDSNEPNDYKVFLLDRMRILFSMRHPGVLRNFASTLEALARRNHQIHLVFGQVDTEEDDRLLESLTRTQ